MIEGHSREIKLQVFEFHVTFRISNLRGFPQDIGRHCLFCLCLRRKLRADSYTSTHLRLLVQIERGRRRNVPNNPAESKSTFGLSNNKETSILHTDEKSKVTKLKCNFTVFKMNSSHRIVLVLWGVLGVHFPLTLRLNIDDFIHFPYAGKCSFPLYWEIFIFLSKKQIIFLKKINENKFFHNYQLFYIYLYISGELLFLIFLFVCSMTVSGDLLSAVVALKKVKLSGGLVCRVS